MYRQIVCVGWGGGCVCCQHGHMIILLSHVGGVWVRFLISDLLCVYEGYLL